jgi:hypothetical protein
MNNKWVLEALWWLITVVLVTLVLLPIVREIPEYPFFLINIVSIVVFVTFSRYIFLLKYTFLAQQQMLKVALALFCIPLVFYLISNINAFQTYMDERGVLDFMSHLHPMRIDSLDIYIRSQSLLFGVGSVIAAVLLPFRLVISVWRNRNKGTV